MIDQKQINRLASESKSFMCSGSVLRVQSYYMPYTRHIEIDLRKLTPEILEQIKPDEDEEEEYY